MITVNEALAILEENLPAPRVVRLPLESAFSRRLAEDILAPEPSPRYTSSAMDGFAVRWQDVQEARKDAPVRLKIAGESQAGIPFAGRVAATEAIRVSTGALLPTGADTVVRVEDTREADGFVDILRCSKEGQDVRYAGEEFAAGARIMERGLVLKARQIALLSAVGVDEVPVYDTPRVSLCITGTELAYAGTGPVRPFQVRDSNSPMLRSAIMEAGGTITECLHVEDDIASTVASMRRAMEQECDVILCSGGVSVGRHDHVKEAAEQVGFRQLFWKISQKPGKPLYVAKNGNSLLFGLPGNPVSAFMCFQRYVLPSLAAMQGENPLKKTITARAEVPIHNSGKRTDFIRVTIASEPNSVPTIRPMVQQGSHMLSSIVGADGYIVVEPGSTLESGELTDVFVF